MTTVDVKGMGLREYLGQGEFWIDHRNGSVFQISEMDPDRRVSAARNLARMATALISLAEAEALRLGEIAVALQLAHRGPREWMIGTTLYRSLYPAPAGEQDNLIGDAGVVRMPVVRRSA